MFYGLTYYLIRNIFEKVWKVLKTTARGGLVQRFRHMRSFAFLIIGSYAKLGRSKPKAVSVAAYAVLCSACARNALAIRRVPFWKGIKIIRFNNYAYSHKRCNIIHFTWILQRLRGQIK